MRKKLKVMLDDVERMHDNTNKLRDTAMVLHASTIKLRRQIRVLIAREDKLTEKRIH